MEVVVSTLRWPVELYKDLKALAKKKGASINQTVVECVEKQVRVEMR